MRYNLLMTFVQIAFSLMVFAGLPVIGCTSYGVHKGLSAQGVSRIVIRDELWAQVLSLTPSEVTVKSGDEVIWVNHTDSVIELTIRAEANSLRESSLLGHLAPRGLLSREPTGQAALQEQIGALEAVLRSQQQEMDQIREELSGLPQENGGDLAQRFRMFEERLRALEDQLDSLKKSFSSLSSLAEPPVELPRVPAFITPYASVRGRFDHPGHYTYSLSRSFSHRRSATRGGRVQVLP